MRLKMYRTISGSKSPQESHSGIKFGVPQDTGSMGEAFTMYSRPSAFGPPTRVSASSFRTKNWNKFKKSNSNNYSYDTSKTYLHVTASSAIDGYNFPFTPPYYHGEAWADITFIPPDGTKKYTLAEVINNSSVEFFRYFNSGSYELYDSASVITNDMAMQIASSMNIFSKGILRQDLAPETGVVVETQLENKYRWIMQSKFECPALNFNHHSHDSLTMPNIATSSVPIGMWHQYGRLPQETNEGIFIQVEDVPRNWVEGALLADYDMSGSLLGLCGFSTDPIRVGEIKDTKLLEEAVVAIPFISNDSRNNFFKLNSLDVEKAIDGKYDEVGETVGNLVKQLRKYVFPPTMDFFNYSEVTPFSMYIFEFNHTLSQDDLSDIWQGLPPKIGTSFEIAEDSISHPLLANQLLGSGEGTDKSRIGAELNEEIRWMVFKVKKRAKTNYFDKIVGKKSGYGQAAAAAGFTTNAESESSQEEFISYNWPYDFFSLVELVKIDAEIEFSEISQEDESGPKFTPKRREIPEAVQQFQASLSSRRR